MSSLKNLVGREKIPVQEIQENSQKTEEGGGGFTT